MITSKDLWVATGVLIFMVLYFIAVLSGAVTAVLDWIGGA